MSKSPTLKVSPRIITGRKVKSLRRESILPANIFGNKVKSTSIKIALAEFSKLYQQVGETAVINLNVDGEKTPRPVLISHVHNHPVTGVPLHVDFHQVDLKVKVTATVPVEIIGESPAIKEKGGVLVVAGLPETPGGAQARGIRGPVRAS